MVNSRQKGKRGELELCHALKAVMGWTARRSQQFCGDSGDSDVVVEEQPDLFIECKKVQALNLTAVMKLAVQQAGAQLPVVCHRRDREEWLVTIRLTDLPMFLRMCGCSSSSKKPTDETPPSRADCGTQP